MRQRIGKVDLPLNRGHEQTAETWWSRIRLTFGMHYRQWRGAIDVLSLAVPGTNVELLVCEVE